MGRRRGEQSMPCGISGLFGLFLLAIRLIGSIFYNNKAK